MPKPTIRPQAKTKPKTEKSKVKKPSLLHSVKGMHDILPADQPWWEKVQKIFTELAGFYNFTKIETPIIEYAAVFEKTVGENTDIVEHQMFYVKTRGDRLVLRPENTASIVRAYLQYGLSHLPHPLRLYYVGPMFRHEQPQAGRFREFHQAGLEILGGENDPVFDAQVILIFYRVLETLNIPRLTIQVNSIGCRVCRGHYRQKLVEFYQRHEKSLCKDCKRRLALNPMRLLDCKNESCVAVRVGAPSLLDHLCVTCQAHFKGVLEYLDELGLPYTLNPYLVRGLDYYNRTVFEMFSETFSFALAAGGRYDYLVEMMGGRATSAVGGAMGIERLIEAIKAEGTPLMARAKASVFFIHIGLMAKRKGLALVEMLRRENIHVRESLSKESLKSQLRMADREGATFALILGQKEVYEESVIIRDLRTGAQETIPLAKLVDEVRRRLKAKI